MQRSVGVNNAGSTSPGLKMSLQGRKVRYVLNHRQDHRVLREAQPAQPLPSHERNNLAKHRNPDATVY